MSVDFWKLITDIWKLHQGINKSNKSYLGWGKPLQKLFLDLVLNSGWVGVKSPKLFSETSQELQMLSPSLFIQGSQCKC